jgi:hypothetical protein
VHKPFIAINTAAILATAESGLSATGIGYLQAACAFEQAEGGH